MVKSLFANGKPGFYRIPVGPMLRVGTPIHYLAKPTVESYVS
jgi:hypothetical protein